MRKELASVLGTSSVDNLIAKLTPTAETFGIQVKAGEGELARGTVLAVTAAGTYEVLGKTSGAVASCVLADPVDASGEAAETAVAYRSGNFNRAALIVASGYTMTAADEDNLRKYDIILTDMMD